MGLAKFRLSIAINKGAVNRIKGYWLFGLGVDSLLLQVMHSFKGGH